MKNTYIGTPMERREDLRFLRGRGEYVDDLKIPDLLYAVILRSPVAHGRIDSLDASAALKLPGVHAVITAKDMPGGPPIIPMRLQPLPEFKPYEQPVIAHDKVRYVGEPIAVVLADSVAEAEDALEAIDGRDRGAAGGRRLRPSRRKNKSLLFEGPGTNRSLVFQARKGDADAAFRRCALYPPRAHAHRAPLWPHHGAARRDGRVGRGQGQAHDLGRRQGAVLQPAHPGEADRAAGRADRDDRERRRRRLRRARRVLSGGFPDPVRGPPRQSSGEMDRRPPREPDGDEPRARGRGDLEIACARDGTILALRGEIHTDMGAYMRTNGAVGARNISQFMAGPYRVPHVKINSSLWMTNKTPVGTYRGPGRFEANFFLERMIELVAAELGIDRVEFRRRIWSRRPTSPIRSRMCSRPTPRTSTTAAITGDAGALPQGDRLDRRSKLQAS